VNVGIICACLATLKPLLKRYVPRLLSATASFTGTKNGSVVSAAPNGQPRTSRHTSRVGGAVFGSFNFGAENPTSPVGGRMRNISFSEQDGSAAKSPVASSPVKRLFGSFSLRRGSGWSKGRNSVTTPISPVDVEMGHPPMPQQPTTIQEEGYSHDDKDILRPSTATPDTAASATRSGSVTEMNSDYEKSEEDLYHAMLRTQTRDSTRQGRSVSGAPGRRPSAVRRPSGAPRRPSAVAFDLEPQYDDNVRII